MSFEQQAGRQPVRMEIMHEKAEGGRAGRWVSGKVCSSYLQLLLLLVPSSLVRSFGHSVS